jgi:hypothetical protein
MFTPYSLTKAATPPLEWTPNDVQNWIRNSKFAELVHKFKFTDGSDLSKYKRDHLVGLGISEEAAVPLELAIDKLFNRGSIAVFRRFRLLSLT